MQHSLRNVALVQSDMNLNLGPMGKHRAPLFRHRLVPFNAVKEPYCTAHIDKLICQSIYGIVGFPINQLSDFWELYAEHKRRGRRYSNLDVKGSPR